MQTFPTFHLKNSEAQLRTNSDFSGITLFYFYPKDDTPGCTHQACALRDNFEELDKKGVNVVGVSPDDVASHIQFSAKYHLPFELLSDFEQELSQNLGIWQEKTIFGKKKWGIQRSSYLVLDGKKILWQKVGVHPKNHLEEIFSALEAVQSAL